MSESSRIVLGSFVIAAISVVAAAQGLSTSVLGMDVVARGDLANIPIRNAPATAAAATVVLRRDGETFPLTDATFVPPAAGQTNGTATARVPADIPFGDYDAVVVLDQLRYRGTVRVHPPGVARTVLNELSPSHTYAFQTAYRPDESTGKGVQRTTQDIELKRPPENRYGRSAREAIAAGPTPIIWRTGECGEPPKSPGAAEEASARGVIGMWNDGSVVLCRVPEDTRVTFREQRIEPIPVPSTKQPTWIRQYEQGIAERVVDLYLRGSGFQAERPEDNAVWLDGIRTRVIWDGCPPEDGLGTATAPVGLAIRGRVESPQSMTLCSVPVPSSGRLQVAVGLGDTPSETREFRVFSMTAKGVATLSLFIAAGLALVPLALLALMRESLVIGGQPYRFRLLFLDSETETYSLSKLQFYMWTLAALFGYAYLVISRVRIQGGSWPDVPGTLPGVIAVAGGTAIAAQVITTMKGTKGGGEQWPSVADLITSGGTVAIDRVQMLLWTIFGVGVFLYMVVQLGPGTITDLPAVPETLLYLMGLSSAGYLGGKLARKAGPVINEISISPPESDQAIAKQSASSAFLAPNLVAALVEADKDVQALPVVTHASAKTAVDTLKTAVAATRAATTHPQLVTLLDDLGKARTTADVAAQRTADDFTAGKAKDTDAQTAQRAAAALQELAASVTSAVSDASADAMKAATNPSLITRTIEVRGTNLSPDALFAIDQADLPFRMLWDQEQKSQPEIMVREPAAPTLARVLRLTIDPAKLTTTDRERLQKWFATPGRRTFTLTNPDGQKAEVSVNVG